MKSLTAILAKVSSAIWGVLAPLGLWGVFAIAAIDAVSVPLPGAVDGVLASYVFTSPPSKAWLFVLVASVGSTLGNIVPYVIGYKGGEVLLRKRMSPEKFARARLSFDRHEFLALMLPAMLPPPFPFKLVVLSAAVFEMNFARFLGAIFAGRIVRYGVIAVLTVKFGPQIVTTMGMLFKRHLALVLAAVAAVIVIWMVLRRVRRSRGQALAVD